jgi:hypothetical protein
MKSWDVLVSMESLQRSVRVMSRNSAGNRSCFTSHHFASGSIFKTSTNQLLWWPKNHNGKLLTCT